MFPYYPPRYWQPPPPPPTFQAKTLDIYIAGNGPLDWFQYPRWRDFFNHLFHSTTWVDLTGYYCYYTRQAEPYNEEMVLRYGRRARLRSTQWCLSQAEVEEKANFARRILARMGFVLIPQREYGERNKPWCILFA